MRYIEFQVVIGDAPVGMLYKEIKSIAHSEIEETQTTEESEDKSKKFADSIWKEGVIHHLSKETYVWTFSLVYREGNFDIVKWKTSFAWKERKSEEEELLMDKALFIGADGGVFFIKIDEDIFDNFSKLADMMDVFIQKTKAQAPFLVYGILENKEAISKLKTNKELMTHLADVKKWTVQHGGEFKLENLTETKMNLSYLINDYTHHILTRLKTKYKYTDLKLGELHYLDFEDVSALSEIEESIADQVKSGQTVDEFIYELVLEYLKKPEFQEEIIEGPPEPAAEPIEEAQEEAPIPPPSIIKQILQEIKLGIRRQCPKCFNHDRLKLFEIVDRDNIIMQNPTIYGFKYRCGMCGMIWRVKAGNIEDLTHLE